MSSGSSSLPVQYTPTDVYITSGPSSLSYTPLVPPTIQSLPQQAQPRPSGSPDESEDDGLAQSGDKKRKRRFHRRSRNGCEHCKKRRVRCDEAKPVCGNCTRKRCKELCGYSVPQESSSLINPPQSYALEDNTARVGSGEWPNPLDNIHPDISPLPIISTDSSAPLSPNTTELLNQFFAVPQTPPSSHLVWPNISQDGIGAGEDEEGLQLISSSSNFDQVSAMQLWGDIDNTSDNIFSNHNDSQLAYRQHLISDAILRQTHILQQPNELGTYFPTHEQRRQFYHFFNETSNDLMVVPTAPILNPWLVHLTHLALGQPAGHEILHDAFRLGLLSLASFDIGLKMRKSAQKAGYEAMYKTSSEQRRSALKLLRVANALKLDHEKVGADLVLATVAALAIRDRLAGAQDFEVPLKFGISLIMDQGGAEIFIARHPTPGRRFLVEQMATLELLGILTAWEAPRILAGDMSWFTNQNSSQVEDHLTEIYGWDRPTIALTAEVMSLAEVTAEMVTLRAAYRRTPYPILQAAVNKRAAEIRSKHNYLSQCAKDLRQKTMYSTTLHPRAAIGVSLLQACMELLLVGDPENEPAKAKMYTLAKGVLDICETSISLGMYAGLLLPLTWAGSALPPEEMSRLRYLFRQLQPHYHVDPAVIDMAINLNWETLLNPEPQDTIEIMKANGAFAAFF